MKAFKIAIIAVVVLGSTQAVPVVLEVGALATLGAVAGSSTMAALIAALPSLSALGAILTVNAATSAAGIAALLTSLPASGAIGTLMTLNAGAASALASLLQTVPTSSAFAVMNVNAASSTSALLTLLRSLPTVNVLQSMNLSTVDAKVLVEVLSSIQETGLSTVAQAEEARDKLQAIAYQLQSAHSVVEPILQNLTSLVVNTNLTALTAALNNSSTTPTNCDASRAAVLGNITRDSGAEVTACFTDKVKAAQDILESELALNREAVAVSVIALAGIYACPPWSLLTVANRMQCIVNEAAIASDASFRIVQDMAANKDSAKALYSTAQADIEKCVVMKIASLVVKTARVAIDMKQCAFLES